MDNNDIYKSNDGLARAQSNGFFVAVGLAVIFCIFFELSGVSAEMPAGTIGLEYRINPNDAPPASLARLPGVGLAKAQAIVTYRQQFRRDGRGDLAFRDCNDLDKVKGIGPVTARNMCEWLKFQ